MNENHEGQNFNAGPNTGQQSYQQQPYPQQGFPQPMYAPQPPKKNWFLRHKILSALLALFVIGGIGSAMGGGNSNSASTASSDASSTASAKGDNKAVKADDKKKSDGDKLAALNTPVRDGKFEFTVVSVQRGQTSVGQQFLEEKAQGEFTVVKVTVKNIGNKAQTLFDDNQKAFSATGQQFSTNSSASIAMPDNSDFFVKEINPGNTATGYLVFDAPVGTKLTSIEFHDSMFSGGVKASL